MKIFLWFLTLQIIEEKKLKWCYGVLRCQDEDDSWNTWSQTSRDSVPLKKRHIVLKETVWLNIRNYKWTFTNGQCKNWTLNFKIKSGISRSKNRNLKRTVTITWYKNYTLKSTESYRLTQLTGKMGFLIYWKSINRTSSLSFLWVERRSFFCII